MRKATKGDLQNAQTIIAYHLEQIAKCFNEPKVTLIVRTLDVPKDGDMVFTDDDPRLAIASLLAVLEEGEQAWKPKGVIPSPFTPDEL